MPRQCTKKRASRLSMILEGMIKDDGAPVVYEETCFIVRPSDSASISNDSHIFNRRLEHIGMFNVSNFIMMLSSVV